MRIRLRALAPLALWLLCLPLLAQDYVPPRDAWAEVAASEAGFDPSRLAAAVDWARANGEQSPADLRDALMASFGPREPEYRILGPVGTRGSANGMILRGGRIVAEWGDTARPEMTFSVAKSTLSVVAGLAFDDGWLPDPGERVAMRVHGPWFEGAHNGAITWSHLLQQTSDWSGTLWGIHDWADRPEGDDPANRPLHAPGTRYKYNDVRVNLLALALLELQREPAPQVFKRRVMDPIGASPGWRWAGYDTLWIARRSADAVGVRRRHGHQHARSGALRPADAARRCVGRAAPALVGVDRAFADAVADQLRLRLSVVAQYRTRGDPGRTRRRVLGGRFRRHSSVHRSRTTWSSSHAGRPISRVW